MQTARRHEEPFAVQFSIFMSNRVGQFREVLDLMAENDVLVVGVSVVDSTDWAVVRMVVDNPNKGRELLKRTQHPFVESEVLLVELETSDSLRELCGFLLRGEINVHFAFPLTIQSHQNPVMAFHVDDPVLAREILTRRGMVLLGSEDLADPT